MFEVMLVLWAHTYSSYDCSLPVLTYLAKHILNILKHILEFTSREKNPSLLINCYAFVPINT